MRRNVPESLKKLGKVIGHCRSCNELIWWVYRYGSPIPYDVGFETDGTPYRRKPHRETCIYAVDRQPRNRQNLRDRADAHTEAIRRWKISYVSDNEIPAVNWNIVTMRDVPEKHAVRLAWILAARGGPFANQHPIDTIPHFKAIAVADKMLVATLIRPAFFNLIHHHIHGFMMSVLGDMPERKPVWVAGNLLEPGCVVRSL